MKWLVVVDSKRAKTDLTRLLADASARALPLCDPIPLSEAELSVEVEGPEDLPARLESHTAIKGVYPSSDLTLY